MDFTPQPLLSLENVGFSYPGRSREVLRGVSLQLRPGETVLLTGPTGCGKSTLLKTLNGIIPLESSGRMTGRVLVEGRDTALGSVPELAQRVGLVFQSPDDQLFCGRVGDEVAFGPQNLGLTGSEVDSRVHRALDQVGMAGFGDWSTARLSGGQKQRVAIACQLAMRPSVLALDEPISQLDPEGAAGVLAVLKGLAERGMAVLLVEHRLGEAVGLARRMLVMDQGALVLETECSRLPEHVERLRGLGLQVPDQAALAAHLGLDLNGDWQRQAAVLAAGAAEPPPGADAAPADSQPVVEVENLSFTYPGTNSPALDRVSLVMRRGEVLGLMGRNGSGKSTLLGIMAGLMRPGRGRVLVNDAPIGRGPRRARRGRVGLLFQNPDLLLVQPSVRRELLSGPRNLRRRFGAEDLEGLARSLGLETFLDLPPWALSKGQRLRVALAALMAMGPDVLLLDEPTTGQNRLNIRRLLAVLGRAPDLRATVICSHDLDTVCRYAHRLVVLHQGRVLIQGPIREVLARPEVLKQAGLKPTLALEMSHLLGRRPPWLTCRELISCLPHIPRKGAVAP